MSALAASGRRLLGPRGLSRGPRPRLALHALQARPALRPISSFIKGTERDLLPVIVKAGGTVDRVNYQLDKADAVTDSAVSMADSADTAVRAVSTQSPSRSRRSPASPPASRTGSRRCEDRERRRCDGRPRTRRAHARRIWPRISAAQARRHTTEPTPTPPPEPKPSPTVASPAADAQARPGAGATRRALTGPRRGGRRPAAGPCRRAWAAGSAGRAGRAPRYDRRDADDRRAPGGLPLVLRGAVRPPAPLVSADAAARGPLDALRLGGDAAPQAVLLGRKQPPAPRFTTAQKCLRAGGKDTDLDEVGLDRAARLDARDARRLLVRRLLQGRRGRLRLGVRHRAHGAGRPTGSGRRSSRATRFSGWGRTRSRWVAGCARASRASASSPSPLDNFGPAGETGPVRPVLRAPLRRGRGRGHSEAGPCPEFSHRDRPKCRWRSPTGWPARRRSRSCGSGRSAVPPGWPAPASRR